MSQRAAVVSGSQFTTVPVTEVSLAGLVDSIATAHRRLRVAKCNFEDKRVPKCNLGTRDEGTSERGNLSITAPPNRRNHAA